MPHHGAWCAMESAALRANNEPHPTLSLSQSPPAIRFLPQFPAPDAESQYEAQAGTVMRYVNVSM